MVPLIRSRTSAVLICGVSVALVTGCAPSEPVSTHPGSTPPIWTGAPMPAGMPGMEHGMEHDHGAMHGAPGAHTAPGPAAMPAETLTAAINAPDGSQVAAATIEFDPSGAFATVTVQTVAPGKLSPGWHGLHIHDVGKCEANSVAPTGGAPGDFLSAGGHFQGGGQGGHPGHAGDLTSLEVRGDGSALLVTTTDTIDKADLLSGDGTAIIIHANPDNFGNIPAERYRQINGAPPPDETTLSTGDGGKRVACGVINAG